MLSQSKKIIFGIETEQKVKFREVLSIIGHLKTAHRKKR